MKYLLIVLSLAVLTACESSEKEPEQPLYSMLEAPPAIQMKMPSLANLADRHSTEEISSERKLITTGFIRFEVANLNSAHAFIEELVKEMNGYIVSDKQETYPTSLEVRQDVRIPADKLNHFIIRLDSIAKDITAKNLKTEDVTDEFIDNTSRIVTKKELEKRYREILNHATKVSDMLQVEEQLEKVRGEIESMEGRLHYISNQTAFSSLTLGYSEEFSVVNEFTFGSAFIKSLGNGWHNLELFLLKLIDQWPFILTSIIVFILIYRWVRIKIQSFRKVPVTV